MVLSLILSPSDNWTSSCCSKSRVVNFTCHELIKRVDLITVVPSNAFPLVFLETVSVVSQFASFVVTAKRRRLIDIQLFCR